MTTGSQFNTLAALLEHAAAVAPDAIAIEDPKGRTLTHRELHAASCRLADKLRAAGVKPGDRVGICMPKSINSVISVMGAIRARAAYVPVDFSAPAERNRYIFDNCQARVICADEPRGASLTADRPRQTLVFPGDANDGVGAPWLSSGAAVNSAASPAKPEDLAYILYTSGSTGLPKGVMHTNASAMSFVNWCRDVFDPKPTDRFSSHAPFHFDLSILDLYTPLTVGAAIVLVDESLGKEPHTLGQYISDRRISVWYSVPSILALLAEFGSLEQHDFTALRLVLFAGEVFPVKHLRALKSKWKHPAYYNLYGPTETNVCTYYKLPKEVEPDRTAPYPIGIVCENDRALVLDLDGKPVTGRSEGVLYIHDSGTVMKGYWADEQRTDASFHMDSNGERWYCTGDVVVPDDDGNYLFVGRRDRMVKRRGYRIELGEIEAGLYRHPDVDEAAAIAMGNDEGVVITAFLAPKEGKKLSIIALKQFCMQQLPAYMIPDRFTFLTALPRTSTDKVDYQTLKKSI